jgi:hypothetical protein
VGGLHIIGLKVHGFTGKTKKKMDNGVEVGICQSSSPSSMKNWSDGRTLAAGGEGGSHFGAGGAGAAETCYARV